MRPHHNAYQKGFGPRQPLCFEYPLPDLFVVRLRGRHSARETWEVITHEVVGDWQDTLDRLVARLERCREYATTGGLPHGRTHRIEKGKGGARSYSWRVTVSKVGGEQWVAYEQSGRYRLEEMGMSKNVRKPSRKVQ